MSVRGALDTMAAEDVLEWVARRRLSAPVTFERRGVIRTLVLEDGAVVYASSNRREEQLGNILVRSGLVTDRALAEALEARAQTGIPLGKVLLMSGHIKEIDLVEILATKIRETVTDVVTWTDGSFEVVPRSQPPVTGVAATLAVDVCLTVAHRRSARMREITAVLGSDEVVFYVPPGAVPPATADDQVVDVARLWALAGERASAADLVATCGGERHVVLDALARMIEQGQLVIDRRARVRASSAAELAAGARERLRQGDRAGALAMATQALHQDPSDGDVRKTFAQAERARVAEVAKQLLARHSVPRIVADVTPQVAENLGLTAVEIEIANRVDGRWDLLSVVRSASVREAEALLALHHLSEVGILELG